MYLNLTKVQLETHQAVRPLLEAHKSCNVTNASSLRLLLAFPLSRHYAAFTLTSYCISVVSYSGGPYTVLTVECFEYSAKS